jgi:hypothetical protein
MPIPEFKSKPPISIDPNRPSTLLVALSISVVIRRLLGDKLDEVTRPLRSGS